MTIGFHQRPIIAALEARRLFAFAGPDGFGYEADPTGYEELDLVPGGAGVTSFLDNDDDTPAAVSLGGNTFNFYGQTYSQIHVTPNGLITLGGPPTGDQYNNTDLTEDPPEASIAVLWDDYVTNAVGTASGAFNDVLLSKLDTANNRLIIEWNCVRSVSLPAGAFITFQAILELNTGSDPGDIIFNYVDLDFGNALLDNGGLATVGIKDEGVQSESESTLLIHQDFNGSPVVQSEAAILVTKPPAAGTGSIAGQLYHDKNFDGAFGGADTQLNGVTVYLDGDNDGIQDPGEQTQVTSGSGDYTFTALADGTYRVRVADSDYWVATPPSPMVSGGGAVTGVSAGAVALYYGGTGGNDTFLVRAKPASSNFEVIVNGASTFVVPPTVPPIRLDALDGNDVATLQDALPFQVNFDGGSNSLNQDTLNVNAGTYTFVEPAGATTANLNLNVAAGANVVFQAGHQRLVNLNLTGLATMEPSGEYVFQVNTFSLGPSARLDLKDNDLVVENMSYGAVYARVIGDFGAATGLSSSAGDGSQILALFDNALVGATEWLGVPIGANAIVGMFTYFGDVNFDGQVTGDDYTVVDANLNTTAVVGLEWLSGDANLDGLVTGDDYTVIDANLGLGSSAITAEVLDTL